MAAGIVPASSLARAHTHIALVTVFCAMRQTSGNVLPLHLSLAPGRMLSCDAHRASYIVLSYPTVAQPPPNN